MKLTDLIITKTIVYEEYTIDFLEYRFGKLSPSGKYMAYLLTSSIVINRLKAFGPFQKEKINTGQILSGIIDHGIQKYENYKRIYKPNETYNNIYLNQNSNLFFKNSIDSLTQKSLATLPLFGLFLEDNYSFNDLYINLYIHPFFNTDLTTEYQKERRKSYIESEILINFYETDRFRKMLINLIDDLADKMNNDSFYLSQLSSAKQNSIESNKNCYIATLAFQDINHPKVEFLRQYRDNVLNNYLLGKKFIKYYYRFSPKIVEKLKTKKTFNNYIRTILNVLIFFLRKSNFESKK